jgi:hypothetical protein
MKLLALAVALLLTPSVASAEDMSLEMWLSWYDGIHVSEPLDQVKDGCWPSPAGTKAVVEKELLSLNVPLKGYELGAAKIMVKGMGWATLKQGEGNCVGRHTLALYGSGGPEGGYSVPYEAETMAGLYVQPKNESQATMDQVMKSDATRIAVAWVKSRPIREARDKRLSAVRDEMLAFWSSLPEGPSAEWAKYLRRELATSTVSNPK